MSAPNFKISKSRLLGNLLFQQEKVESPQQGDVHIQHVAAFARNYAPV